MNPTKFLPVQQIQNRIFNIRGLQVMIDRDLAELYGIETKNLNRAANRNKERFPGNFRFQLTQIEYDEYEQFLRFQFGTLKKGRGKHRKYLPYVFTEYGVAMLSAVLHSKTAINVSIQIMQAFVEMKKLISINGGVFQRIGSLELKQTETDQKFDQIFSAMEDKTIKPVQGVYYNGQIYDAYIFVSDLIRSTNKSVVLIDNYIDDTVLTLLTKRKKNISTTIYTKKISKQLSLDLEKNNAQYPPIKIKEFKQAHDRFIVLDDKTIFHFGASLKDLGKKWFAFSKMEVNALEMLNNLKDIN